MNGIIFKNAVISAANSITKEKQSVDDLNIFPVPDGDTGTNMSMTIASASDDIKNMENLIESLEDDDDVQDVYHNWETND